MAKKYYKSYKFKTVHLESAPIKFIDEVYVTSDSVEQKALGSAMDVYEITKEEFEAYIEAEKSTVRKEKLTKQEKEASEKEEAEKIAQEKKEREEAEAKEVEEKKKEQEELKAKEEDEKEDKNEEDNKEKADEAKKKASNK